MIVHKVNDSPSAKHFHQRAKNYVIFAKFYSPTCPACIASEEEWGRLKENIAPENRDHFDLAEVDPEGMRELQDGKYENMNIDVQFVPTFAVMKDGKVADIYEGDRNHRDMIQFLKDKKYLKEYNEMNEGQRCRQRGGANRTKRNGKRKSKKKRTMRKKKKGKRSRRRGIQKNKSHDCI